MWKRTGKYILFTFFLIFFLTDIVHAREITVTASVSATVVEVGEQFIYTVTVSGSTPSLPEPKIPKLPDFRVYQAGTSSSFQIINGSFSASVNYQYALVPLKAGEFVIPPAKVVYDGKTYQTQSFKIRVVKQRKKKYTVPRRSSPQPQPNFPFFPQRTAELFIRAIPNKRIVYVNEPVLLRFKIYYRNVDISRAGIVKPPKYTGFIVEDIPPKLFRKTEISTYQGKRYYSIDLERVILFPTTTGKKRISSAKVDFIVEDIFSFFGGKKVTRETEPVVINVLPLPERGKPDTFKGSVGVFNISTKLSTRKFVQNQPFSLKIIISGTGNIKSISEPEKPDLSDFKVYDTRSYINIQKHADRITGNKIFEYILMPLSSGRLKIGSFIFSYFNYKRKKYITLKTRPIEIEVKPGKAGGVISFAGGNEIKLMGKDIRFIKEGISVRNQHPFIYRRKGFYILLILPFLILGGSYAYYRYTLFLEREPAIAKSTRAYKKARKLLKKVEKKINKLETKGIDTLIEKALIQYISEKFNIPLSEIVLKNIRKILKSKKVENTIIEKIESIYEEINFIRYAPVKNTIENYRELLKKVERGIEEIEKKAIV